MKIPSPEFLLLAFVSVIRRFPLSMLSAAAGAVAAMLLIEQSKDPDNILPKILMTAALGLPLFLSASLIAEKRELDGWKTWIPSIVSAILLVIYFFTLELEKDEENASVAMRFAGLLISAHLLVAIVPHFNSSPVHDFWEYNKRLFGNFLVGAFFSLVIYAGLSIAILAVDNLFELEIDGEIYGHLFIVIAAIFNTTYFLNYFPKKFSFEQGQVDTYTTPIKIVTKYIFIPIIIIYFLILYAYSGKILFTWELPKGWVSSLVIGFSVAGIFTYLLNDALNKFDDSPLIEKYRKWFFFVLLPMVLLLFFAIGRRLMDYGVTEDRFVVAACGVWLLLIALYFIFSKKDNIKFIPASLLVFIVLSVIGPFNAFRVSSRNQANRLLTLLEKNNMIKDGVIQPKTDSISPKDAENIGSIIRYMQEYGHFKAIKPMFAGIINTDTPSWSQVDSLIDALKLPVVSNQSEICFNNFKVDAKYDIVGFNTMERIYLKDDVFVKKANSGWKISEDKHSITLMKEGAVADYIDLREFMNALFLKNACKAESLESSEGILESTGKNGRTKLIIENISFEKGDSLSLKDITTIILSNDLKE